MKAHITEDMLIGEVMRKHPETRRVFVKYFGGGCFACPGTENEDIYFGARIHNVDTALVLEDLNRVVNRASGRKRG